MTAGSDAARETTGIATASELLLDEGAVCEVTGG
jgi:hypothetical protein